MEPPRPVDVSELLDGAAGAGESVATALTNVASTVTSATTAVKNTASAAKSTATAVTKRAATVTGAAGSALDRLNPGRRHRRSWACDERAHIEVRGVERPESQALRRHLERSLRRLKGVRWAQVNPVLGRVVVALEDDGPSLHDLLGVVAAVEHARHVDAEPFPADRPEHPCDAEPIRRSAITLGADALGLGASLFGRAFQLAPIPTELATLVSIIDNEPRARKFLEDHLGAASVDLGLGVANAASQALSQGPLSLVADMTHRANLLGEAHARRRAWERREPALHATPEEEAVEPVIRRPRPAPLRPGPVERYAEGTALAALGGSGAALAATGSPRRAAAMLAAGVPKAARQGRDAFAAHLGREMARRDIVVLDESVLRRLDRIDAVVIDAALVESERREPGPCQAMPVDADPGQAASRIASMFDPGHPNRIRSRGHWKCGPLPSLLSDGVSVPDGSLSAVRRATRGGREAVGLALRGSLVAMAPLERVIDPLAEALVATSRGAEMDVFVAGGEKSLVGHLGATGRLPGGRRLTASVRGLQSGGSGVLLVSCGDRQEALEAADCGVGVAVRGVAPPWSADVLVGTGFVQAFLVVSAAATARKVSARSAGLALAGSAAGAAVSLAGPAVTASSRAALPVNVAAMVSQAHGVAAAAAVARQPAPSPTARTPWHAMDAPAVLEALHTGPDGLSAQEAARRHVRHRSAKPSALAKAGRAVRAELANPLTPILAAGAGLSAAVGSLPDAALVAGVTVVNSLIGAAQRVQADVSISKLARASTSVVEALRSGDRVPLARGDLVPGDVVSLSAGDQVPADCRIMAATGCEVDESALTGESMPVAKSPSPTPGAAVADRHSMLYDGTTVSSGTVLAVVVAVGDGTEVGRSLADAPEPPPSGVEARLRTLTSATLPATLASGAAVAGLGLLRSRTPRRAVTSGVGLTVAAVPEGLPLLATTAQQAAARRLAGHGALVRDPRTIEALGRVDTLCFDKTGTLTAGEIGLQRVSNGRVDEPVDALGARNRLVLAAALRASPGAVGSHDADGRAAGSTDSAGSTDRTGPSAILHPTDRAVVTGARRAGVGGTTGAGGWRPVGDLPFDPARGFHAVVGQCESGGRLSVKGAPEVILPRCSVWCDGDDRVAMDRRRRRRLDAEVERLAGRGLRVLAVAERRASERPEVPDGRVRDMELLGFVALADSVRPQAARAVDDLRAAGIDVVMITGDHPSTAGAVATDLGILNGHRVMTGTDLEAATDEDLDAVLPDVSVFARVTPTDKVRIVRAYQRAGRVVAMTGDGANDAPAIRLAHTGIALGSRGTPAAREAADLVVVDDRMETILDAVVAGRSMWVSVRDALAILVGGNLGEVGFALAATALTGASPLEARQFLLVNLLTDMVPAMAVALRPPVDLTPASLLAEGPDRSLGSALASQVALRAVTTGSGATAAWLLARTTGRRRRASTVALAALVCTQLGQTAVVGHGSPLVLGSVLVSAAALAAIVQTPGVSQFFGCTPLGPLGWTIATGSAAVATGASLVVPWAAHQLRPAR